MQYQYYNLELKLVSVIMINIKRKLVLKDYSENSSNKYSL